jgi:GT2 family glycosyltransferase
VHTLAIDNGSIDGTVEKLQKDYPDVELIENGTNLGFGQANNIGLAKALNNKADYVFLLNQDAWIKPNTISKLISTAIKNPEAGIISPIHLNGNEDKLDFQFKTYLVHSVGNDLYSDLIINKTPLKKLYYVHYVNAAAWLIKREILQKIGGFDPLFDHYGEDNDYINRLIYHKYKIGIETDAFISHDREDREVIWDFDRKYAMELIKLKDIKNDLDTLNHLKWDYYDSLFKMLLFIFSTEKSQRFKERAKVLLKLKRNYSSIVKHREKCMVQQPNFLEKN